jgi:hypothetical protein
VPSLTRDSDNARQVGESSSDESGSCSHRMRVVGSVRPGPGTRLDCDQPLRSVCVRCDHLEFWRCDSYGCTFCGERKRKRLARLVDNGSAIHLRNGMRGYFLTLTAPGVRDHKRWYQGVRPSRRVDCGCHLHGFTDGQWNAQESACWNRLRTAMTRDRSIIFAGAVETQERGMLHRHVLVFADEGLDYDDVQTLAVAAGYGCVLDIEPVRSAEKAARYISKYVTKSASGRAVVPWEKLDPETGELHGKRATYRLWSSSRKWGVTMKQMRSDMAAQARARARYLREYAELLADDPASAAAVGLGRADSGSTDPP